MVIYITENLINGKKYIGKDTKNKPYYLGSGKLLKKAINKYGIDNFKKTIIETCENREQLSEREKYWINFFNAVSDDNFYNIVDGGEGGDTFSSLEINQKKKNILVKSNNGKKRAGCKIKDEFIKKRGDKGEEEWELYQNKRKEAQAKSFLEKENRINNLYGTKICTLYMTHSINDVYLKLDKIISKEMIKKVLTKNNIKIKQKKGVNSGEKNGMSKLSYKKALEIRDKYKSGGYTYRKLSEEYSISASQIGQIIRGETYK